MPSIDLKVLWIFFIFHLMTLSSDAQQSRPEIPMATRADTTTVNRLNRTAINFIQIDLDSTRYYATIAKDISDTINFPFGAAQASLHLSSYYNNKGNYALAMANVLRALTIFDSLKLTASSGNAYVQLAYIYKTMASQNRTPSYLNTGIYNSRMAFKQYKATGDTAGLARSLNMTGILYRDKYFAEKKDPYFDTAFNCYQEALRLIDLSAKGEQYLGTLYNNISQVYTEHRKDFRMALDYLFKAVAFNKLHNNKVSLLHNYSNIAAVYRQTKAYDLALKYADEALVGAEELGQPNRMHDALYELFQIYDSKGQYREALHYYLRADRITDSLSNIEKTTQVAQLRTEYEAQKNELKINQLNLDKLNIAKRNRLLTIGLGIFVLLAIALVILYRRVQLQKRRIGLQSARLTTMMKELHHRVKNNLQIVSSLLSLQSYKTNDEKAVSAFRESQHRVQAMSLIHQRLYNTRNVMNVDMKEYLTDLARSLIASFGFRQEDFALRISVDKQRLDVDKALPIGLIVNEIITNAMKYAYTDVDSPQLFISLKEGNHHLVLTVRDNGSGMDLRSWKEETQSFGKQLINALSTQLRASQEVAVNNGTHFTLMIPTDTAA